MSLSAVKIGLLSVFAVQVVFGVAFRHAKPNWQTLPPVPTPRTLTATAFGDDQFLFRVLALRVQTAGDFGGRIVPVSDYNLNHAVDWLEALEGLDPRSDFTIGLADSFFAQSQDAEATRPVIAFMRRHVDTNPPRKWHWLYAAISLARYRVGDQALALDIARQLASYEFPELPPWATMTPAFILEDLGRYDDAHAAIRRMQARFGDRLSPHDRQWSDDYLAYLAARAVGLAPPRPTWIEPPGAGGPK